MSRTLRRSRIDDADIANRIVEGFEDHSLPEVSAALAVLRSMRCAAPAHPGVQMKRFLD